MTGRMTGQMDGRIKGKLHMAQICCCHSWVTWKSKVPCAKDWSNDKATKWRREKPCQKYFQTLKKDHQITHMTIICRAVEETHIIYGQTNFWYLFWCFLIIISNSLPNFEANNTLWCTAWNWSHLEYGIVGIGILHLAKRLCRLQHQYNMSYINLVFIVELNDILEIYRELTVLTTHSDV